MYIFDKIKNPPIFIHRPLLFINLLIRIKKTLKSLIVFILFNHKNKKVGALVIFSSTALMFQFRFLNFSFSTILSTY